MAFLKPGDEVIVFEPFFDQYTDSTGKLFDEVRFTKNAGLSAGLSLLAVWFDMCRFVLQIRIQTG